jgi:hypothetical protein
MTRSFGRPEPFGEPASKDEPAPVPVLHVGEVHAELRLHVTDDTLQHLGSQIASLVSAATRQGFEHGLAAAMGDAGAEQTPGVSPGAA